MTRADTIRALLERWHDLNDPHREGEGGSRGLVLMPHDPGCRVFDWNPPLCTCFRASVQELERLFGVMKGSEKEEVRQARWCLLERYVRCRVTVREVRSKSLDKHGHVRRNKDGVIYESRPTVVTIFDSRVDPKLLEDGIVWLAWNWGREVEPALPSDLRRVA